MPQKTISKRNTRNKHVAQGNTINMYFRKIVPLTEEELLKQDEEELAKICF